MAKLKKIDIENLECPADKNFVFLWDSTMPGFGVRCTSAGVKSFVVRYRVYKKQRIKTLGRTNILDLTAARDAAKERLAQAAVGDDPFISSAKDIQTVKDLAKAFQRDRGKELKPKTLENYESMWKHIIATIGDSAVVLLGESEIKSLRDHLNGKPTTFNRCLSLMCAALKWQGVFTENHPFNRAKRFKEKSKQRILSKDENANFYKALGEFKRRRRAGWRYADLFILLLLTGLRLNEWRCGRWEWISWPEGLYILPDNKTGGRTVYLSSFAMQVLEDMHASQRRPKRGFIFPAAKTKKKPMSWTWRLWDEMRREVGLDGFRIHDMRHTAGSYAHSFGNLSQRQVADFLGHTRLETSSRYIHDNEKKKGAEAAAGAIAESWGK